MQLTLEVREIICEGCRTSFKTHSLSDFTYGERLIYTCDGKKFAYVNFIDDFTFVDLSNRIDRILKGKKLDTKKSLDIFNRCLKEISDLVSGQEIDPFRLLPKCINCESDQVKANPIYGHPPEFIEVERITHSGWDKLNGKEKDDIIEKIITSQNECFHK